MLAGGPLSGEYQMLQLHFHWGEDDTRGSEHTIDGKEYPLEVGFRARNEPSRSFTPGDLQPIMGLLRDCETSNIAKVPLYNSV